MRRNILVYRLFVDINVILDVAELRTPHYPQSQEVLSIIEKKKARGFISAASYPVLFYLLKKEIGAQDALNYLRRLLKLLTVVAVGRKTLESAMEAAAVDFEDGIQLACAQACRAHYIITRDLSGYDESPIPALSPTEYLALD